MNRLKNTPALFYLLSGFFACLVFLFSASLPVFAVANKVDPNGFGGSNRLEFYQTKGTLSSVDLSGISGATQYNVNKEEARYVKDIIWSAPNNLTKNSKITAHFKSVASYDGKDLNCDVILSNFNNMRRSLNSGTSLLTHNKKNYFEFVRLCNNLYNGIDIQGFGAMNMQLNFTYSSNGKAVNLDAPSGSGRDVKGSYLTLACLDGHYHQKLIGFEEGKGLVTNYADHKEFIGYQKMTIYPYYLTSDTALGEYGAPMKSSNNLCPNVAGGRAESGYSTDDHFDGEFGSSTYNRSGITYTLQGTNPQFMVGTNIYSMYFSFMTASIWSKFPPVPSKESYNQPKTDAAANDINKKYIAKGSDVYYHIKQGLGQIGIDQLTQYSGIKFTDNFDGSKLELAKDKDGKIDKPILYCVKNGKYTQVDKLGTDRSSMTATNITYISSSDFLKDHSNYGQTYVLELHLKAKTNVSGILKNVAQTTFNNTYTQNTNAVESYFLNDPTKTVTQNGQDVNGRNKGNKGDPDASLNLGSIVEYTISQKWHQKGIDTDNDHYSKFQISDPLNNNLSYQVGSAKVIDQSTGKDITSQGTLNYDQKNSIVSWNASTDYLKNSILDGRSINLIFDTKTPKKETLNITNVGNVIVDNGSSKTNQTIIGVKNNYPELLIPRTGSYRQLKELSLFFVFLIFGLALFLNRSKKVE